MYFVWYWFQSVLCLVLCVSVYMSCSATGVHHLSVHGGELFSPEGELAEGVTAGEVTGTSALEEREDVIHRLT